MLRKPSLMGLALMLGFLFTGAGSNAYAGIGETEITAAGLTAQELSIWLQKVPDLPKTIGLFSIKVESPLEADFGDVLEAEVVKYLHGNTSMRVFVCAECRTPRVQVMGDRVVISRGAPDAAALQEIGKKMAVEAFITLDVYRTKLSLITQATIFQTGSGQIVTGETFKVPALEMGESSIQIALKAGPGFTFGTKPPAAATDSIPPFGANLSILEELGNFKGGLQVGTVLEKDRNYYYLMPSLGWRGRFGATRLSSLTTAGAGFGYNERTFGPTIGAAYDLYLGSLISVGVQGSAFLPMSKDTEKNKFQGFIGLTLGISFGR